MRWARVLLLGLLVAGEWPEGCQLAGGEACTGLCGLFCAGLVRRVRPEQRAPSPPPATAGPSAHFLPIGNAVAARAAMMLAVLDRQAPPLPTQGIILLAGSLDFLPAHLAHPSSTYLFSEKPSSQRRSSQAHALSCLQERLRRA